MRKEEKKRTSSCTRESREQNFPGLGRGATKLPPVKRPRLKSHNLSSIIRLFCMLSESKPAAAPRHLTCNMTAPSSCPRSVADVATCQQPGYRLYSCLGFMQQICFLCAVITYVESSKPSKTPVEHLLLHTNKQNNRSTCPLSHYYTRQENTAVPSVPGRRFEAMHKRKRHF